MYKPRSVSQIPLYRLYDPAGFPFKWDYLKSYFFHLCYSQPVTNFYITCSRNCSSVYSAFCTFMVHFLWFNASLILICVILIVLYGALNINVTKNSLISQFSVVFFSFFHSILENLHFFKICPHKLPFQMYFFQHDITYPRIWPQEFFTTCPRSSTWIVHLQLCSSWIGLKYPLAYFLTLKSSIYPSRTCSNLKLLVIFSKAALFLHSHSILHITNISMKFTYALFSTVMFYSSSIPVKYHITSQKLCL